MRINLLLLSACMTLPGCGNLRVSQADWPFDDPKTICTGNCNSADSIKVHAQALNYCRTVQNHYESGSAVGNSSKFLVGALGVLSGSVIAPIAHGSAAKAWAGLSGATNAVQRSLDESFSTAVNTNRRFKVWEVVEEMTKPSTGLTDAEKIRASLVLAAKCSMASAVADQQALRNINNMNNAGANTATNTGGR